MRAGERVEAGRVAPQARRAAGCALFLFAALASLQAATARTGLNVEFRGDTVKANLSSPALYAPHFGFAAIRVTTESTDARELEWSLKFEGNFHSNLTNLAEGIEQPLRIPARRVSERWVFVPTAGNGIDTGGGGYSYGNLNGTLSGRGIEISTFSLPHTPPFTPGSPVTVAPCAVSTSLEPKVRAWLNRSVSGNLNLSTFDPAQPVGDWRAWSAFAHVIMAVPEYEAIDPATRVALRSWVALGGTLHLVPDRAAKPAREPHGAGAIVTAEYASVGAVLPDARELTNSNLAQPTRGALDVGSSELAARVPTANLGGDWLLYFFIGFAVLIAPVNLFAIAPARKRHRLFLTVPAFSLAAVLALGVTILLQDGMGGSGARRALVVLVPGENQAAIFQEQVARTGLLFRASFPLADDTLCAQVPVTANITGNTPRFQRSEGEASGDWFRSRARQAQHLRRLTPTRARVELVGTAPDGAPIVQSSVGTTLREFCFLDAKRLWWFASELEPGKRVTLVRIASPESGKVSGIQFDRGASAVFRDAVNASYGGVSAWRPGHFIARAGDNELAPLPTLASIRWEESAVLFTGLVEGKALR